VNKVFIKVLHSRLLPCTSAVLQHNQANQLFALRQIVEFNIATHHFYIYFMAANETITRNKIYVIMVKLNFCTKLIRLTKATLTTVKCCVKIQNDCSDLFKTRPRLREGDVLSTLLFNSVLEAIVLRAKLQTQLLRYAYDRQCRPEFRCPPRFLPIALEAEATKVGQKIDR
jgi:hypothetical protein